MHKKADVSDFDGFCRFIQRQTGYRGPVSRATDLIRDLGVAGIDGEKFATALEEEYGYTMSDGEIAEHFGDEVAMSPWQLVRIMLGRAKLSKPLSVGELYEKIRGQ